TLHRQPPRVGLHAADPAARAAGAAALDHHVADLTRRMPAGPRPAVQDETAANTRSPEDAQDRPVRLPRSEPELGHRPDPHVVAEVHRRAELVREAGA